MRFIQNNIVLSVSLFLVVLFVIFGAFFNELLEMWVNYFLANTVEYFGWFYLTATLVFLIMAFLLIFSKYGKIRLGKDTDRPVYSKLSWISMLFSAGMGIGLVFWGVAEPLFHYMTPPFGEAATANAANTAMTYTYFHWGLHPWAVYTLIGLSLAFFQYRKDLPGLISSTFYPIIGNRIYGPIGKGVDVLAIFATVFGIATSLGLGTMQIAGGLSHLFDVPNVVSTQIFIILIVTVLFAGSALIGINRGMKILSNFNILLAFGIMMLLLFLGPTSEIFKVFTTTTGSYLDDVLYMSLRIRPFGDNSWIAGWTLFYWAWWIAWAPFVGSFIAKVSKGRTIKEFILGVLFIPTIGTFAWFSVFGGSSLHLVHNMGNTALSDAAQTDVTEALFVFFQYFPFSTTLSFIAVILVVSFFVTSADSSTFILSVFSSKGNLNPSWKIKLTWGCLLSLVSIVLLLSGSLETLQSASIAAAFPFAIIMSVMCYSLLKGLILEHKKIQNYPKRNVSNIKEKDHKEIM
ncbi:glycine betaine uptake BCCT transporter [Alteribacillus bidgolensis]|uniref:Glycine betaine transporter n=1 Tax=Alteribacillus bidgolensis TaxID=930129 RepID=A0A1G8K4L6_9BACI|nr:BCCT family transporter [Alteribacillus bidgolensis]SDI37740.1 glycine betaine transporter [Alteribacillus bidgolensis]